jgi:S-DNA-T family DNA segregation ATPase FtsK/SpoIIIE
MARKGTRYVPVENAPTGRLSARTRELLALAFCGFCLYVMLCLATYRMAGIDGVIPRGGLRNLGGSFGYYLAGGFAYVLGFAAFVPVLTMLAWSVAMFLHRELERVLVKALGAVVFAAMLSLLLAGFGEAGHTAMTPQGAGGAFGANLYPRMQAVFGGPGRLLLVGFGALVSFFLATEWMFSAALLRSTGVVARFVRSVLRLPQLATAGGPADSDLDEDAGSSRSRATRSKAKLEPKGKVGVDEDDDDEDGPLPTKAGRGAAKADGKEASREASKEDGKAASGAARSGKAASVLDGDDETEDEIDEVGDAKGPKAGGKKHAKAAEIDDDDEDDDSELPAKAKAAESAPQVAPAPAPVVIVAPKPKPKLAPKPKPKKPAQSDLPFDEAYPFPPIELLREVKEMDGGATEEQLQQGGAAIVQKLASFDVQAHVVAASIGPAVTQYELKLAEGIRVNKVTGFQDDLAAALKAVAVRVVAPIPGKDTIGIEVPNAKRQMVFLRELLEQYGRAEEMALPLFLGKDVAGAPIVEDLAKMPHLLIAGTTGSGKSVCINTILLSILMTRTPQQAKLILVDPKMVELMGYKNVPHLCCDVVTNMKKTAGVLQWAVDEMENRYAMLSAAGVRDIKTYNRLGQPELERRLKKQVEPDRVQLPYIVIVIDEFADLMNVAQNEVEESIQRLAQKSRAVGMHVILATQRPSSEVITGIIKSNLPCQIAFKVNRKLDSRVILDVNGAEKLLGQGDMLYVRPGNSGGGPVRAQGAWVSDEEIQGVVSFLEERAPKPDFIPGLVQTQTSSRGGMAQRDELYVKAVEIILGSGRGSATLLQRSLGVGYTRGTRLLEMMEEDGLVGAYQGSKSREVLMTLEEWQAREAAMAAEMEALDNQGDEAEGLEGDPAALAMDGEADAAGSEAAAPSEAEASSS